MGTSFIQLLEEYRWHERCEIPASSQGSRKVPVSYLCHHPLRRCMHRLWTSPLPGPNRGDASSRLAEASLSLSLLSIKFLSDTIFKLFNWEYYALPNSYQLIKDNLNGILLILSLPNRQCLMLLDKNTAEPWITLIKCKYNHGIGQNVFYSFHAVSVYGRYGEGKDDFIYTKHTIFKMLCQLLYVGWFVTCNCHNQLVRKFLCPLPIGSL